MQMPNRSLPGSRVHPPVRTRRGYGEDSGRSGTEPTWGHDDLPGRFDHRRDRAAPAIDRHIGGRIPPVQATSAVRYRRYGVFGTASSVDLVPPLLAERRGRDGAQRAIVGELEHAPTGHRRPRLDRRGVEVPVTHRPCTNPLVHIIAQRLLTTIVVVHDLESCIPQDRSVVRMRQSFLAPSNVDRMEAVAIAVSRAHRQQDQPRNLSVHRSMFQRGPSSGRSSRGRC